MDQTSKGGRGLVKYKMSWFVSNICKSWNCINNLGTYGLLLLRDARYLCKVPVS